MGHVHLVSIANTSGNMQALKHIPITRAPQRTASQMPAAVQGVVSESYHYETSLGDVRIQEIRGDAEIFTGAGEVQLGAVAGRARVRSHGGPLQLGEMLGRLNATTRAGDILVDSARKGGLIRTEGGTIQLLYTSGPTTLYSGGGNITVRQAAAPIEATTTSGDVSVNVDPLLKKGKMDLITRGGNILFNVSPQFAADIDATIITTSPENDTIQSDFPGLTFSRDQVEGKTRIRATGKINGGGERVVLRATGGDIRISHGPMKPTVVTRR